MSAEERVLALLHGPDPFSEKVDRVVEALKLEEAFEECWTEIEEDWEQQRWPTFKEMAHSIFGIGFYDAVLCVLCKAEDE